MPSRGGSSFLSAASLLILLPAILIALVLGFLLLRFVPRPMPPPMETSEVVVRVNASSRLAEALASGKPLDKSSYLTLQVLDSKSDAVEGAQVYDGRNFGEVLGTTSEDGLCAILHESLVFETSSDLGVLRVEH